MDFVLHNLRLQELVAVVQQNRLFFDDFVIFLREQGYDSLSAFIHESSDEKAAAAISEYLSRPSEAKLYDGLLRPYPNSKAKWFFLAWLFRDAATQRLEPLLRSVPGDTMNERKAYLLNEIRRFVEPLFPEVGSWEWPAISEVMLARLEGSRRALKGTLFEEIVRRNLRALIERYGLPLTVGNAQVKIGGETYDVQVTGGAGSILLPIKTRETMGGGHSLLFTRDIYKSIMVATEHGYRCVPIVIAESWAGNLDDLKSELYIYIQANPNQVAAIEPLLLAEIEGLVPLFQSLSS